MIEVRNLTKRFGTLVAVDRLGLTVRRGEVLGVLGPNGAGKTTTMRMIAGFLVPSAGEVRLSGIEMARAPKAAKALLGYLPEGAPAYPDMTARGYLGFIADVRRLEGPARRAALDAAIMRTGIGDVLDQPVETLSKGFQRRLGLAQAILHDPEILVLDEPTDGLDPNQKHEVRALIRDMAPRKAILISTHILEEVEALCSRAVVIDRGRIVLDGTPSELQARSRRHNAVRLVLADGDVDGAAVARAIAAIGGIETVQRTGPGAGEGRLGFAVYPADGRSIVAEIAALAAREGWRIASLHAEAGRLDDVFREVTAGEVTRSPRTPPGEAARSEKAL